jgi:hypothetical protein
LRQSTLLTWKYWFPEKEFGRLQLGMPMIHHFRPKAHPDVESEVWFMALDKDTDVSKLRSTEWTGIWFNELEYIPRALFDEAESRVGYYPPVRDGGPTWAGVLADLNAPSEDCWVVQLTGEVSLPESMPDGERQSYVWPENWDYFVQPPGLIEDFGPDGKTIIGYRINPEAENLKYIPKVKQKDGTYLHTYLESARSKTKQWIDSRIMNRIVPPVFGSPCHPSFRVETHVAQVDLVWEAGVRLVVSLDFGRRPFALFMQMVGHRWHVIAEFRKYDASASVFAPLLRAFIRKEFPEAYEAYFMRGATSAIRFVGDPKGQDKGQADERTAYEVFAAHGMRVNAAPIKATAIRTRLATVDAVLGQMVDGVPKLLLSARKVPELKMALAGGYHFSKDTNESGDILPEKDKYSEPADCLQYGLIDGGEGYVMTGRDRPGVMRPAVYQPKRKSLRRGRAA